MTELLEKNIVCNTFVRPPEIEDWLRKLRTFDGAERLRLFSNPHKNSGEYVPSEALVYFLRRAWAENIQSDFNAIFTSLIGRIKQSLRRGVSDSGLYDANLIRDEIQGAFAEKIANDCNKRQKFLDFFEVRFDKAFKRFRISELRKLTSTVQMVSCEEDEEEISEEDVIATDFLGKDCEKLSDPAFRLDLSKAIARLPDDQKQVIGLLLQGFPTDSTDTSVMTIASILKCTPRTVQNRRERACKALTAIFQKEKAS